MNLSSVLWFLAVLAPLIVQSRPQYRQRLQPTAQGGARNGGRFRGRGVARRRRPPPVVRFDEYDDGTEYEESEEETTVRPPPPAVESSEEEEGGEEGCGTECRNLLHESDHRKEDARCPYEGMVIDIWGYCR